MKTDLIDLGIEDEASFELVNTLVSYVMEYILVVNLWRHLIGVRVNSNNAQLICCIGFGTENAFGGGTKRRAVPLSLDVEVLCDGILDVNE